MASEQRCCSARGVCSSVCFPAARKKGIRRVESREMLLGTGGGKASCSPGQKDSRFRPSISPAAFAVSSTLKTIQILINT